MILGRSPALWIAAVAAILNVAVIVFGVSLTAEGIAALNAAAIALIGLVANATDPTTAPTFAMTTKAPNVSVVNSSTFTASSSGTGASAGPGGASPSGGD